MTRPVHFEILAKNPEKVAAFYSQVFGWKTNQWEGPEPYWLVSTGPEDAPGIDGGIMAIGHFTQPVINTICVDKLEDTLQQVERAGGRKVQGPNEIPGIGLHAYCADPEGILFGLLQPSAR